MKQRLELALKEILNNEKQYQDEILEKQLRDELFVIKKIHSLSPYGKNFLTYDDILYDGSDADRMVMSPANLIMSLTRLEKKGLVVTGNTVFKDYDCQTTGYKFSKGLVGIMRSYSDKLKGN